MADTRENRPVVLTRDVVRDEFAGRHYSLAVGIATQILGGNRQDAEDVVQEVLTSYLDRDRPRRADISARAYFIRSVQHAAHDLIRRNQRKKTVSLDALNHAGHEHMGVENAVINRMQAHDAAWSIRKLPEAERRGTIQHIQHERHDEEDSEPRRVRVQASRGQKKLRAWNDRRWGK